MEPYPIIATVSDISSDLVDDGRATACIGHGDIVDKVGAHQFIVPRGLEPPVRV
jgi:hypothetical protein